MSDAMPEAIMQVLQTSNGKVKRFGFTLLKIYVLFCVISVSAVLFETGRVWVSAQTQSTKIQEISDGMKMLDLRLSSEANLKGQQIAASEADIRQMQASLAGLNTRLALIEQSVGNVLGWLKWVGMTLGAIVIEVILRWSAHLKLARASQTPSV